MLSLTIQTDEPSIRKGEKIILLNKTLSICPKQTYQGEIWIENKIGKYTTFTTH